jgi:hypothetical protein
MLLLYVHRGLPPALLTPNVVCTESNLSALEENFNSVYNIYTSTYVSVL